MGRIFGTDGARGVANTEIGCKLAMDIGRASAMVVSRRLHKKVTFVVGKDTRISSDMLENAIVSGLCSVGANVIKLGFVPTPAVAYLVKELGADGGVMLSASHNPFEYNGIKIFNGNGFKLTDDEEFEIEEIVLDHKIPYDIKWGDELGRISRDYGAKEKYIDHIVSSIDGDLKGLKIAIDCSNGSSSYTAFDVFKKLGADATIICAEPDGININDGCGSTHIENISSFVQGGSFDMGFAFDGDADRCLAVDNNGDVINGDQLIAIISAYLKSKGKLKGDSAVVTQMSNMGFFKFARENGINTEITKVGDRYVLERLIQKDYTIGGEQSGHIIFRDYMTTGDGQLTAVQLAFALKDMGKSLKEASKIMKIFPQEMINVRADKAMKNRLDVDEGIKQAKEKFEAELGDNGRILLRPSGTEPLIRVMVEGEDKIQITRIATELAKIVKERLEYNEDCKQLEGI